jgi:hypothetical protein
MKQNNYKNLNFYFKSTRDEEEEEEEEALLLLFGV